MFYNKSVFKVGNPITTVEHKWFSLSKSLHPRTSIPGQEIKNAYPFYSKIYESLADAKAAVALLAQPNTISGNFNSNSMQYEYPIFELNGDTITYVYFRNERLKYELLDHLGIATNYSCIPLARLRWG